jgi:hypothetical protein
MRLVLVFYFLLLILMVKAQVVNVERFRIKSDTTGWFGEIGLSGTLIKSSSDVFLAESNLQVECKRKRDLYLFVGNYSFLKGDGTSLIDEAMLHIRYNLKLNKRWRWEAFTQFQQNEILHINTRFLLGTGPRFKAADTKTIRIYIGSLLMYEYEEESVDPKQIHIDGRSSSYVSFNVKLFNAAEIISTTYFQPLVKNLDDYRFLNQSSLRTEISKHFFISINYNFLHDRKPATGIFPESSKFTTGINYKIR